MGAAFCVKNIAEAECATREHVSARKRACPKLLVVGRSLCSALVPKSWPSADSCWTLRHATCHHALHKTAKSKWLQEHSARKRWSSFVCKIQQSAPILGPGTWALKGGPPKLLVILLKNRRGSFLGPLVGPQNGGRKNIAKAECATREHVSARKRACPKLLVVGRSLCSALVPKSWPSADSCWTCAACNLPSCVGPVEVVARTLRPQLRRSAGARLFAKHSAKRPPFWGPERGP